MPTRKKITTASGRNIETPEIIFLALPVVALAVVLLVVSLNGNSAKANGKPSTPALATVQAVSAVTPTLAPVTSVASAKTTVAATTAGGSNDTTPAPVTLAPTTTAATTTMAAAATTTSVTTAVASGATQTVKAGDPEGSGQRLTKTEGGLNFVLLVSPGHLGNNTYDVALSAENNRAVTDATLVRVSVKSLDMEMGVATLDLKPVWADHPGVYSGLDSELQMLSMVGKFDLAVLVQRPGQSNVTADFQLDVANS